MTSVQHTLNKVELVLQALLARLKYLAEIMRAYVRRPGRQGAGLGGDDETSSTHPGSTRNGTNREREVARPTITASTSHYIDALDPDMRREIAAATPSGFSSHRDENEHAVTYASRRGHHSDYLAQHYDDLESANRWRYGDRT